jgi:acetolactate synthase-1/3 small subunit
LVHVASSCIFLQLQVRCTASQRGELRDLVQIFRLGVIDVAHTTMTLEVQGREDKMSAIADLLEPYGGLCYSVILC